MTTKKQAKAVSLEPFWDLLTKDLTWAETDYGAALRDEYLTLLQGVSDGDSAGLSIDASLAQLLPKLPQLLRELVWWRLQWIEGSGVGELPTGHELIDFEYFDGDHGSMWADFHHMYR